VVAVATRVTVGQPTETLLTQEATFQFLKSVMFMSKIFSNPKVRKYDAGKAGRYSGSTFKAEICLHVLAVHCVARKKLHFKNIRRDLNCLEVVL